MSALAVQSFGFGDQLVRTVDRDGAIWFVANDVCGALEIANSRSAVAMLDGDEKGDVGIIDAIGREQSTTIISESGVYCLVFKSRKPVAVEFRRWVTREVLPALREHGRYDPTAATGQDVEPAPDVEDEPLHLTDYSSALAVVREARQLFGRATARKMWPRLGLPSIGEVPAYRLSQSPNYEPPRSVVDWRAARTLAVEGVWTTSAELFTDYVAWCEENGRDAETCSMFGLTLTNLGNYSAKSGIIRRHGIRLKD